MSFRRIISLVIVTFLVWITHQVECAAAQHVIVSQGQSVNVRADGWWTEKYYSQPGMQDCNKRFIEIAGTDNYIYAARPIGHGDFHIKVRLAVFNILGNTPAFACNSFWEGRTIDALFFHDDGEMILEGRLFGLGGDYYAEAFSPGGFEQALEQAKTKLTADREKRRLKIAPTKQYIKEGEPFVLEVVRKSSKVDFLIDGKLVKRTDCPITRFGEVGFRSLGANIRLYDFSIEGNLLELEDYLLNISSRQRQLIQQGREGGLLKIAPVHLPEGDKLIGRNWHYMAPIATMIDDVIVMTCHRHACHDWGKSGRIRDGLESDYDLVSRSNDGGKTWSEIKRLVDHKTDKGVTKGSMGAIGQCADGTIVQINHSGVYRSADKGVNWEYLADAYSQDQIPAGPSVTMGPRLLETAYGLTGLQAHGRKDNRLWLRYSIDKGITWQQVDQALSEDIKIHGEPSALMWQGNLIILGRVWSERSFDKNERTYRYGQYWSHNGKLPVQGTLTNIKASDAYSEWIGIAGRVKAVGFGPWCQDTPDIIYNPVSKRIEAVVTNRGGGGFGRESDRTVCTLNLWSIDPEDLLAGSSEWRFEGTLLERLTIDTPKFHDGMHPAGGVVDVKRNLHHIFVWIGYYDGPAGIFQISRSLETNKVAEILK